jgi:hypothetical protein
MREYYPPGCGAIWTSAIFPPTRRATRLSKSLLRSVIGRMRIPLLLLLAASCLAGAEPNRDAGLSVQMVPERVARRTGVERGFAVVEPGWKLKPRTYARSQDLLTYIRTLGAETRENGVWVLTIEPRSYSDGEQVELKNLVALCAQEGIPVYVCQASELPGGWKRQMHFRP